ncbi:hypothetical protein ACFLWW_04095 [Chloroflexota bacterium]
MDITKWSVIILLIIGTVGLLLNELVFDWGRAATIIFSICNIVGLATLVYATWSKKNKD